jgi:hypothetical protein
VQKGNFDFSNIGWSLHDLALEALNTELPNYPRRNISTIR